MFPPVAEAGHALPPQSAIDQRAAERPPGDSPKPAGNIQFPILAEAEAWLQSQGFWLVANTCDWTNAAGDDAGVYSIDGRWGQVKGWRVEINRRSPKPVKGLSRRRLAADRLRVGSLELDPINRTAKRGDRSFDLRPREVHLLEYMMRHTGELLTRAMLFRDVWHYNFVPNDSKVVDVYLGKLRRNVDGPGEMPMIRNVRGAGFILDAPLGGAA
jgi:DNA-binding winged helix-turn-helix (wHTH) protein